MRSFRSKPVGWRNESQRHYLAAKGISTGRKRYYSYVPTYAVGDIPVIGVDAVGVAGAEAVSLIPVIVPVALAYGGAKLVKKRMESQKKKGKGFFAARKLPAGDVPMGYIPAGSRRIYRFFLETEKKSEAEKWRKQLESEGHVVEIQEKDGKYVVYEATKHAERGRTAGKDLFFSKKHNYTIDFKPVKLKDSDMEFVGIDRKGRRVRKYGKDHWNEVEKEKYERVWDLKKKYEDVMRNVERDMASDDEEMRKNARAAYIIAKTGMRPGTRKEMKADQESFGVTTLRKDQVKVADGKVKFNFIGKHGIPVKMEFKDARMAKEVKKQKAEVGGKELFPHASDATVRNYLYKYGRFKPKDFRTLKANNIAEKMVRAGVEKPKVTEKVAKELANTPGVSEHSYINPSVWRRAK